MTAIPSERFRSTGPRFSVIVPAYNVAEHIGNTLASLAGQSVPFHEVIVIDDGSTDGTAQAIARALTTCPPPGFSLLTQDNAGVSVARNAGLAACTGDFVIFLDGDDVVSRELSRTLLDESKSWTAPPEVILWKFHDQKFERLLDGDLEDRWPAGIPTWSTGPETLRRVLVSGTQLVSLLAVAYRSDFLRRLDVTFTPGCLSGEDTEFQRACLAHAAVVRFIDEPLSTYVWRDDSVTNSLSLKLFDGVLAHDRSASYLASCLGDEDHDVVEAAGLVVPPRFLDLFVAYSRVYPGGGFALLRAVKRSFPALVPRVRDRIRQAEALGQVDRKWALFRLSPTLAAWYFSSTWSQSTRSGIADHVMSTIHRIRPRNL